MYVRNILCTLRVQVKRHFCLRAQLSAPQLGTYVRPCVHTYVGVAMAGADSWMPSDSDEDMFGDERKGAATCKAVSPQEDIASGPRPQKESAASPKRKNARGPRAEKQAGCQQAATRAQAASSQAKAVKAGSKMKARLGLLKEQNRKRRLLMRRGSSAPDLIIEDMICLRGKPLKKPVVVFPVKSTPDGKRWLPVNAHQMWLRRVCHPGGLTYFKPAFQAAVTKLRRDLCESFHMARDAARPKVEHPMSELFEEEDSFLVDQCGKAAKLKAAKLKAAKPKVKNRSLQSLEEPVDVALGDVKVQVRTMSSLVLMECTVQSVGALVNCVKAEFAEIVQGKKKAASPQAASSQKAAFRVPVSHDAALLGKVSWQPSIKSWAVHYKTADKQSAQYKLRVLNRDVDAAATMNMSRKQVFEQQKEARKFEAMKYWNEHDKSSRERIDLS